MEPVARALDELYSTEPSEFTKKRDALVKDLKKAGDKDGAALIAAKRKPTQVAYVLNQLARQHPDAVADLVDVGRELAREQRRALRGETTHGLRDSIDRQRKAIAEAGQKAAAVMKDLGMDPASNLQEVTMALQAALVDPMVGAALEAGQLEKAPEAAVSFGGAIAATDEIAAPAPRAKKKSEPPPAREPDRGRARARAREEEAEAEAEAEREKAKVRAAHAKSVAEAKAVLAAAASEARRARDAAERAATEAEAAELVAQKAKETAAETAKEAKRLAAELATAERTVAAASSALAKLVANEP